jgi:hypothetical protein
VAVIKVVAVIVRGTVGMHVEMSAVTVPMLMMLHGLAVYGRFSCAAAAYITH